MSETMQIVTAVLAFLSSALTAYLTYKIAVLQAETSRQTTDLKKIKDATGAADGAGVEVRK